MLLLLQIDEIATRYQLHTFLPSRSALPIRQKFQWTSEQLKSVYVDLQYFRRRSSKFPAEHLSLLLEWFTPFFISIILPVQYFGLAFIKRKHHGVEPIHGPWSSISKTSHLKLKREVSRTEKKVQDCDYVFGSSTTFQRRKEWIYECRCCQESVPLNVFAFYPSVHFTLSLHFTPGPQPAVRSLRFTLIDSLTFQQLITIIKTAMKCFWEKCYWKVPVVCTIM